MPIFRINVHLRRAKSHFWEPSAPKKWEGPQPPGWEAPHPRGKKIVSRHAKIFQNACFSPLLLGRKNRFISSTKGVEKISAFGAEPHPLNQHSANSALENFVKLFCSRKFARVGVLPRVGVERSKKRGTARRRCAVLEKC